MTTPARCRKVAAEYRKFPPKTKVYMPKECGCAAGIIGSRIKGDGDNFDKGVIKIRSILTGKKLKIDDIGTDAYEEMLDKVNKWLEPYLGDTPIFLFGTTLKAYGLINKNETTTGWLANWWDALADKMEGK